MNRRLVEAIVGVGAPIPMVLLYAVYGGFWHFLGQIWMAFGFTCFALQYAWNKTEPLDCAGVGGCLAEVWARIRRTVSIGATKLLESISKARWPILVVVFLVQPLVLLTDRFVSALAGYSEEPPLVIDPANDLVGALSLIVLWGPLIEEFLFRGVLQDRLTTVLSAWPSVLLSSLAFALYLCYRVPCYTRLLPLCYI